MSDQQRQQSGTEPADQPEDYGLPQPPEIERQWAFTTLQKIGVPLLLLIPLLALLGLFGQDRATVTETGSAFALEISYPTRNRYKLLNLLTVSVENRSGAAIPTATVSFAQGYISNFSAVSFTPEPSEVTERAYFVQLDDLQPGEARLVVVEMDADQYWHHEGTVAVAVGGPDSAPDVAVNVSTLVYP